MKILNTKQFCELQKDPTKNIEMGMQRAVRKIKNKCSPKEYLNIYPTGSSPGKFYGTAKKHKLTPTGTIDDLPIRPIICNLGTASYQLAKYLARLLFPLSKSEHAVDNNVEFINNIKSEKVLTGHSFISFDVKSLFTKVPLDYAINIILRMIYDDKELYKYKQEGNEKTFTFMYKKSLFYF